MARLTAPEATWSRPVVHDILEAGGLLKHSVRTRGENRIKRARLEEYAKVLCDEIKFRNFDFPKTNEALTRISNYVYFTPLHDNDTRKRLTEIQLAHILAAFCAEQEIYWDDVNTARTTVEMETYYRSYFGKACLDFKCFLSQQAEKKPARSSAPRAASGASTGSVPSSGYKTSGPKSGLIKGLIGEPGEKHKFPSYSYLYDIICVSDKKKKQFVFIDPLAYKSEVNRVRFGDPSGWSACKLFFETREDAEAAINTIYGSGSFRVPADISGMTPAKQKVDPNGYFKVMTEVGAAYIKASKLNEAIAEEVEADAPKARASRFPEINDIDVYNEAMHRFE